VTSRAGEESRTVEAGRVGRPHGLDGSFYVTGARPRLLEVGAELSVGGRTASVNRRAGTDARPIIRLDGVADREAALALRGAALIAGSDALPELGEGEWWAHELEGCEVRDGSRLVGTVSRLLEFPSCEVLEVRRAGGEGELLVPLVKDAIRRVSVGERLIEIDASFLEGATPERPPRRRKAGDRRMGAGGRGD
jgi:16S rRNA processing protein RimM